VVPAHKELRVLPDQLVLKELLVQRALKVQKEI
jgi:hypothetical protein